MPTQSTGRGIRRRAPALRAARSVGLLAAIALGLTLAAGAAAADEPAPAQPPPWEQGVAETNKKAALSLFREGNLLYAKQQYHRAAARYRKALELWDHPRIHGNLASALIYLDDPVAAMEEIERALEFGPLPFEPRVLERLRTSQKLLSAQLARLTVVCTVDKVSVTVDGKPLLVGAGRKELRVRAGRHEIVAKRAGYLTESKRVFATGGTTSTITLSPVVLAEATIRERKWAVWKPWAVVGGGAAVALLGLPLGRASVRARSAYEAGFLRECPRGCADVEIPADVIAHRDRARLLNRLEVTAYAVGSVALVAGSVLAYINRERELEVTESGRRVSLAPLASPETLGLVVELGF